VAKIFTPGRKIAAPFSLFSYSVKFYDLVYVVADFWELKLCCRISVPSGERKIFLQIKTMPVHFVNFIAILLIQYIADDRYYLNTKKRTRE